MSFFSVSSRYALAAAILALIFSGPGYARADTQDMTPLHEMPAGTYTLDKTHASLIWKVSHAGLSNYTARFKRFDASITLDPKEPTRSTIVATIDPLSLETDYVPGERDFNKELATDAKWLNAGKFPTIRFESTTLEKTGDTTGIMQGKLTMLGVTKPVTLDVTFNGAFKEQPFSKKPTLGFSASGTLARSTWGLDTYLPAIGDNVTFQIEAEFALSTPNDTTTEKK